MVLTSDFQMSSGLVFLRIIWAFALGFLLEFSRRDSYKLKYIPLNFSLEHVETYFKTQTMQCLMLMMIEMLLIISSGFAIWMVSKDTKKKEMIIRERPVTILFDHRQNRTYRVNEIERLLLKNFRLRYDRIMKNKG
jgi:hypothetical protein